jgi:ribonuclease-3
MDDIKKLEKSLDYQFKNKDLIIEALTHKSYKKQYNNERLEFLGDAVIDLIIGEYLFKKFPKVDEGELSKLRASLVNEKGLEKLAKKINLGNYIFISLAEENNNGRDKPSLLSNAFEAVIGAVYLESGLKKATDIVLKLLDEVYPQIDLKSIFKDYKTTLQELTQAEFGTTPEYTMLRAFGPDHKKEFEIEVGIKKKKFAVAKGKSKKDAQQKAAKKALEILLKGTSE